MRKFFHSISRRIFAKNILLTWVRDTLRMRSFVIGAEIEESPSSQSTLQIGVVITPWCGSAVPWLSMAIGLLLAARRHNVTFVLDDLPFGPTDRVWHLQLLSIRSVMSLISRKHRVVRMSSENSIAATGDNEAINALARLNSVWAMRGEAPVTNHSIDGVRKQLVKCDAAIGSFLTTERFSLLVVPGGIWGSSGLWLRHARNLDIRVSTYDSGGYGVLLLCVDGIACQLQDIPRAFKLLKKSVSEPLVQQRVSSMAMTELTKRRNGTDKFASQVTGSKTCDRKYEGGVLIALNSSWDSAALGLHTAFDTNQDWLVGTVRHLLEKTDLPVVVRQHPVERLPIAASSDDYHSLLNQHFAAHPRLHFISAHDPVNSYELIEQVDTVLVYTSTIGVEAAAQGKIVITESSSYYADLGFVYCAKTQDQYFQLLISAAAGQLQISDAMRLAAVNAYYITQCCNWVQTPLTVPDFPEWSRKNLSDLALQPAIGLVIDAIETDVPVAFLNHLQNLDLVSSDKDDG